ncbi:hypothetical protein D3C76_1583840 [compost metagenome]
MMNKIYLVDLSQASDLACQLAEHFQRGRIAHRGGNDFWLCLFHWCCHLLLLGRLLMLDLNSLVVVASDPLDQPGIDQVA